MRVLNSVPSCELRVHKGVVGLIRCTGDSNTCSERYHRIFTGRVELQAPDGTWLIDGGSYWWFGTFKEVLITTQDSTDANELASCEAHTALPIFPLSIEGVAAVAKQLIDAFKIATNGGGFVQVDYCQECGKLKDHETALLSSEKVNASSSLLPQHAAPILEMVRRSGNLCRMPH